MTKPSSLNRRQEAFCRECVLEPNATRAAVYAGYAPGSAHVQANRLLGTPAIQERIRQHRAELAARQYADTETLMAKLEAVYRRAFDNHQMNAAVRALTFQARLAGLTAAAGPPPPADDGANGTGGGQELPTPVPGLLEDQRASRTAAIAIAGPGVETAGAPAERGPAKPREGQP